MALPSLKMPSIVANFFKGREFTYEAPRVGETSPIMPLKLLDALKTTDKPSGNIIKGNISGYSLDPAQTDARWWEGAFGDDLRKDVLGGNLIVASRYYPKGTKVKINGRIYEVKDKMGPKSTSDMFDILFPTKQDALNFGRQKLDIEIIKPDEKKPFSLIPTAQAAGLPSMKMPTKTAESMTFEVGAGFTPEMKAWYASRGIPIGEDVLKKETIPVGTEVKLPFMQKAMTLPSGVLSDFAKVIVEYPERMAVSGKEFLADTLQGRVAEPSKNKLYSIPSIQQTMSDVFFLYSQGEVPAWIIPLEITGAFLDLSIAGSFAKGAVRSLAKKATEAEIKNAWDFLGRPKTVEKMNTTVRELQKIYHPDMPTGNATKSTAINNAYNILKEKGLPTGGILERLAGQAAKLERPVSDLFKTEYGQTGYAGTRGLLTEQAGAQPVQPFQPVRQPAFGLSMREVPEKPSIQIGTKKISMEGITKPGVITEKLIPKEVRAEVDQLKKQFSQDLMAEIKRQGGIKISPDVKEEIAGSVPLSLLNKNGFTIDEMAQQLQSAGFNIQDSNQLMEELSKLPGARVKPSIISRLSQMPAVARGVSTGTKLGRDIEAVGGIKSPTLVQDLNELAGYNFKDIADLQAQLKIAQPSADTNIQKLVRDLIRINTIKPNYGGVKRLINRMTGVKFPERIIERTEMQLLRNRIGAEAKGARMGALFARRMTRQELITKFKDSRENVRQIKNDLIKYIDENLPTEAKGKLTQALMMDNLTRKNAASIFSRVERMKETLTRKELVGEIKELSVPKGNLAVDYQKQISETISGIDLVKPTEATIKKLKGLRDYIRKEGTPLNIQSKYIEKLDRLTQKNISQLTTAELTELKDTLNQLQKLGKLKQDLKYKYHERERKVALDRLLASTQNIDPKVSGLRTKWDIYKVGTKKAYMDTLHTPRVADMIDGFRGYRGENAKLIKQLGRKETSAKEITRATVNSALEEIRNLGVKELTAEQQIRMMINIRYREGAYDQVKTLMEKNGLKEIPELTDQENKIIEIIKKNTNQYTDDIAAIYEEIENKPFHKLDEYILPLKYEKEFNIIPSQTIEQGRFRTTQTFKGFSYERQKGVTKTPRTDILAIFEEAINEQQWYLNMQPELENIKYLVKSEEYLAKGGEMASNWWRTELDVVARRGWSATARSSPMLRQGRINLNQAILGYKLSSILMQPFAVFDAMAYAQSRYGTMAALNILKEFSKAWIIPKYAKNFIAESPALQQRQAGELAIEETLKKVGRTKGLFNSYIRGGMSLLQKADVITAAGVEKGLLNILEKYGVPNAKEESEFLMNMVSGSNEVVYRPHILASGEGGRTWFTFQTFFMNRWGIMIHDLIISGIIKAGGATGWKGLWKRMSALIGLGIFIAGSIAENQARKTIYEITTGKELPDESALKTAVMFIPEQVPYFGNLIEAADRGGDANPPIIRTAENIFSGGASVIKGAKPETKIKGALRMTEAGITLGAGVPGTAQFFDLLENIFGRIIEGGSTKKGGGKPPAGMPSMQMPSMQMPSMKMLSMKF